MTPNVNAIARTIVAVLLALAWGVTAAGNATAHTALVSSDPADGATVDTAPAEVVLLFTEDINTAFANLVVTGGDGRAWVSGPVRVDGPRLSAPIGPDLPGGAYTIGYRVVSADGHPVSGSVAFTVAAAPGSAAPASPSATPPPTPAEPSSTAQAEPSGPLGSDSRTSIITAGAAGLLVAGGIVFWQSRKRRRFDGDEPPVS